MNMKKTKPKKLLTVLLALCMVLSIVPITAFAAEIDFLPQGVTYLNDLKHTYHTQVNVTANVSVKDSNGAVVETKQVTKSSEEFLEGGVGALHAKLAALQAEIETPYQASGTVTRGDRAAQTIFDHFETASFYTFTPASGDPVKFSTDLDAAKQYFSEHPDATGTFTKLLDVHEYQKYNYTYDLIVQAIDGGSQDEATINNAHIRNVKFVYRSGDTPQATAEVLVDPLFEEYEIAYECWEEMENGEPVAFWYSDESKYTPSMKKITQFEEGKTYMYSIELREKNGYTFADNCSVTINGNPTSATANAVKTVDGLFIMNVETICPETTKEISVIEINNATLTFKDGDKPVFTGKSPEGVKYAYNCEWWELDSKTGAISADFFSGAYENKITSFEAGKTYHYGVYVKAVGYVESENTTYVFGPNTKLKINGEFVNYKRYEGDASDGSDSTMWVLTDLTMTPAADGHTHKYGTEWKYDETNHWHECECGNKADITAHTFKQIIDKEATATEKGSKHEECTVCGYKKAAVDIPKIDSHNHNYGTEWKYDETNHWHECECGNKADITAHNFKWIVDRKATTTEKGSKHEECTVCGYKKTAVDIPAIGFGSSSDDEANKPTNTVSSESSSADQTNKPINTASPKTGNTDNMILWIVLLIAGGGAFITATAVDRKKK
jgi:Zn ribbon nucleic-acid-binding protein